MGRTFLFFLTPTCPVALWRMLCPLITHLYLLCLDVSVSIILVTLNVSLKRTEVSVYLHMEDVLSIFLAASRTTEDVTCLVFAVPKFLMYMSYSLTGGRSKMENVIEKSRSIKRRISALRFLQSEKVHI